MGTHVRTSLHAVSALLYAASAAVVVGAVATIWTQRLAIVALTALGGFSATCAAFAYALWRYRRPRSAFLGRPYHNS